jgi:hypothetical protein
LWVCNAILAVVMGAYVACIGCSSGSPAAPPAAPAPPPSNAGAIYVSPQGLPTNDGSIARPLDLATALSANSPVRAGQTIWLRGGTYRGAFVCRLGGRSDAPIVVRGYPGERAILDGANPAAQQQGIVLEVLGSHVTFWGFEVTYTDRSRRDTGGPSTPNGIYANGSSNIKFINLIVHDMPGQGFGVWAESVAVEVYGNLVYYNGTNHFDHAIYTQNATETKRIEDNILFGQASHGLHAYGSDTAPLDHFLIAGNVSFNNGALLGRQERNILVGGGRVARDLRLTDNYTYYPPGSSSGSNNIGYAAGCADATVTGNAFVGPNALTLVNCLPSSVAGNVFVGGLEPPDLSLIYPDDSYSAGLPGGVKTMVRPNRYEPGRAHVIVYNWDLQSEVTVDLAPAGLQSGQAFEIRDVQDLFGAPVVTGTYRGAPIVVPMTGLRAAAPVWTQAAPPRHTAPEFAVFLVLPR